jgi:hypothetical protein
MSKHVRMHGRQPGTSGRLGEQIVHRLTRERLPTFGDEQPGQRWTELLPFWSVGHF